MSIIDDTVDPVAAGGFYVPLVATELAEFFEIAERHPRNLIVLRQEVPPTIQDIRRYCLAMGGVLQFEHGGEVRTVKNDPSIPNSTAMSTDALALHTDGSFLDCPPLRFLLSFSAKDPQGGGISTFMPVAKIIAAAPAWVLEALFAARLLFVRTYDGDLTVSYVGPALYRSGSAVCVRWRSDAIWRPQVIDPQGTRAADAVDWLHEFLGAAEPVRYAVQTGETLLVPNTAMLHGRTKLSPNSTREVLRAWVA